MYRDPYSGILCGLENEYAVYVLGSKPEFHTAGLVARRPGQWFGQWGEDGSRLYIDLGDHPEYASPECPENDTECAAIYDRAGEKILLTAAEKYAADMGLGRTLLLVKNGTDGQKNYWAAHENYLVQRPSFDEKAYYTELMAYFVTRQVFAGTGMVEEIAGSYYYTISQRSDAFQTDISVNTTKGRPIINTRDEPLANKDIWRRIHVITGEPNILFAPTMYKVRITALLLRMLTMGELKGIRLTSPVKASHSISENWRQPVSVHGRRRVKQMTAVEIQYEYYKQACVFVSRYPNPMYRRALEWWHFVLKNLNQNNLAPLIGQVDWITKQDMLDRRSIKLGRDLTPSEASQNSIAYHTLRGLRAAAPVIRKRHDPPWLERRIQHAYLRPPTSRARARGRLVRTVVQYGAYTDVSIVSVGWEQATVKIGNRTRQIKMDNPLQIEYPGVNSVVNEVHNRMAKLR